MPHNERHPWTTSRKAGLADSGELYLEAIKKEKGSHQNSF